jgi:hypothetical protein
MSLMARSANKLEEMSQIQPKDLLKHELVPNIVLVLGACFAI